MNQAGKQWHPWAWGALMGMGLVPAGAATTLRLQPAGESTYAIEVNTDAVTGWRWEHPDTMVIDCVLNNGQCVGTVQGPTPLPTTTVQAFEQGAPVTGWSPDAHTIEWRYQSAFADVCRLTVNGNVLDIWEVSENANEISVPFSIPANNASVPVIWEANVDCWGPYGKERATQRIEQATATPVDPTQACAFAHRDEVPEIDRPWYQPTGYVEQRLAWDAVFPGKTYPTSGGNIYPVGSYTLRSPMTGKYITIPFLADNKLQHKLEWTPAVSVFGLSGFFPNPASSVYVTISTCPGDFRMVATTATGPANDPTLTKACRLRADEANLYYGTRIATGTCPIQPGKRYYINIVFADPTNGLSPQESTCTPFNGGTCDAMFYQAN